MYSGTSELKLFCKEVVLIKCWFCCTKSVLCKEALYQEVPLYMHRH